MLVNLQPQLSASDDIYIVDTTPDREGLKTAQKYKTSKSMVFVDIGLATPEEAITLFMKSARKNNQPGFLAMHHCLVSQTFITSIRLASDKSQYGILVPKVLPVGDGKIDPNFKWHTGGMPKVGEYRRTGDELCKYYSAKGGNLEGELQNEYVTYITR